MTQSQFMPYNVRELIIKDTPVISSSLFSVCILWSFGVPVCIAHILFYSRKNLVFFIISSLSHGIIAWMLLRNAVPMESIYDIVGAPILSWPYEFEIIGRFLALYYSVTYTALFSAFVCIAWFQNDKSTSLKYLAYGAVFCYLSHFIVVNKASTDNLVELMESGGNLYTSFLIWIFLLLTFLIGTLFSATIIKKAWKFLKILIPFYIISVPAAFLFVSGASEKKIFKYGQEFSALQFLLSPDRTQYVDMPELLVRFTIAFTGIIFGVAIVQIPFWRWFSDKKVTRYH